MHFGAPTCLLGVGDIGPSYPLPQDDHSKLYSPIALPSSSTHRDVAIKARNQKGELGKAEGTWRHVRSFSGSYRYFRCVVFCEEPCANFFITFLAGACAGFRAILRARMMSVPPPRMPKVICPKLMEQKLCQLAQNQSLKMPMP